MIEKPTFLTRLILPKSIASRHDGNHEIVDNQKHHVYTKLRYPNNADRNHLFHVDYPSNTIYILSENVPPFVDSKSIIGKQTYPTEIFQKDYTITVRFAPHYKDKRRKMDLALWFDNEFPQFSNQPQDARNRVVAQMWLEKEVERGITRQEQLGFVVQEIRELHRSIARVKKYDFNFTIFEMTALIQVTNISAFLRSIRNGIGIHRGYGCGLIFIHELIKEELK